MRNNRRRQAALGVLVLAAILLIYFLTRHPGSTSAAGTNGAGGGSSETIVRDGANPSNKAAVQKTTPVPESTNPEAPIIDDIEVEKTEVCRGEENLITVHAHTPSGADDAYLHYFVVDDTGASVPLRFDSRDDERKKGAQRQIVVFGRNNVATTAMLPEYTIKDCTVERTLNITHILQSNTETTYELVASVHDKQATKPFEAVSYVWTFGDGTSEETSVPTVVHDYAGRSQDSLYSQILISCEAIAADGETVTGRSSMQMLNVAFEELSQKGMVKLFTTLEPRFPEMGENGVVTQGVRLWHVRPDPITVTKLTVTRTPRTWDPNDPPPQPEEVDAVAILGTKKIPREGITFKATLDTKTDSDIAMLNYFVEGKSAEGFPVHGNFSVMRPTDLPTREGTRVSQYMQAKILRARELLHKDFVTDEDIFELERQGKMDDIKPEDHPDQGNLPEPPDPHHNNPNKVTDPNGMPGPIPEGHGPGHL